jgi:oligopeptide transport system permease protein
LLWYSIKRLLLAVFTIWAVATITFFLMHAVPGDPFQLSQETPQVIRDNLNAKYGLDKPLIEQYGLYMKNLVQGDLGESIKFKGQTVNKKIASGLPISLTIGIGGVIVGCIIGVVLGIIAALNRGQGFDYLIILIAIIGVSVPSFIFGSLLQYVFGVRLEWLPVAGWDGLIFIILPIGAAAVQNIAYVARMLRTSMLDVLDQDYVYTAISKGLSHSEVVRRHVLRNSCLPLVTALGPMISGAFLGSFVIERIFTAPGLGQHMIVAIQNSDYVMIMGMTVFFSAITVIMLFIVDILYGIIDPRIRINA